MTSGTGPSQAIGRALRRKSSPEPCPWGSGRDVARTSCTERSTTLPGGPKPVTESTKTRRAAPSANLRRPIPVVPPSITSTFLGRSTAARMSKTLGPAESVTEFNDR
jgi:hypothetical protein